MLWNYHDDDLTATWAEVQVTFAGIPAGVEEVLLEHYRIDDTHGNASSVWKGIGSPQTPTTGQSDV
jgi:xylan 1,4-beta-xylosidase